MYHGSDLIADYVPDDNCRQSSAWELTSELIEKIEFENVLDIGCGTGDSIDFFRKRKPSIKWIGLDVENSQEVMQRTRKDADFRNFDGVNIPFPDEYFNLIFTRQVLEHVEKPFELINEICRVMKHGAYLVGSTSYLEAFHSLSTFNYTPHGFTVLLKDLPLEIVELRPGIDAVTLNVTRLFNKSKVLTKLFSGFYERQSPLNMIIGLLGKVLRKSNREINLLKLLFCGHFCFIVKKI